MGMTPSQVGERAEAAVLAALACAGKNVLVPFGGQRRYDLAYEEAGRLVKVQCKSGRVSRGAVIFHTHSVDRGHYRDDADCFGVYCHDRRQVYIVPVTDVPTSAAHLRLDPPRNGQDSGVRWAAPYLLTPQLSPELVQGPPSGASERIDAQLSILTDIDDCATLFPMTGPQDFKELPISCCAPLTESSISRDEAGAAATLFKALADPNWILILNRLLASDEAVCVCELNEGLELSQPTVSFHLKKLVNAGLLAREQRGTWAYYSIVPAAIDQLAHLFKTKETV